MISPQYNSGLALICPTCLVSPKFVLLTDIPFLLSSLTCHSTLSFCTSSSPSEYNTTRFVFFPITFSSPNHRLNSCNIGSLPKTQVLNAKAQYITPRNIDKINLMTGFLTSAVKAVTAAAKVDVPGAESTTNSRGEKSCSCATKDMNVRRAETPPLLKVWTRIVLLGTFNDWKAVTAGCMSRCRSFSAAMNLLVGVRTSIMGVPGKSCVE